MTGIRLAWVVELDDPALADAVAQLRATLAATGVADVAATGDAAELTLVWADRPLPRGAIAALSAGSRPVALCGPTLERADPTGTLARAAGLRPGAPTAVHDVRVRAGPDAGALERGLAEHGHRSGTHVGAHAHVPDRVLTAEVEAGVCVLLTANVGLATHPVAAWRPSTGLLTWTPGTVPGAVTAPDAVRLLLLTLRHVLGPAPLRPVRVGLLGYGAIGHQHSRAVRRTAGLELAAVADHRAERRAAALAVAPTVRAHEHAEALLADDDVDLVVVSTPPDTHARWALAALRAGRHVVVEKPFALRTADADAILAAAGAAGRLAAVYQNRRFDPDHLALRRVVAAGAIGDVFHVEAFVGGHGHPCNLWHSDAGVSGGAVYDWGAHVVDQLLDLLPAPVEHVTATEQKRRWHDVTNADHARVTIRFEDGAEASFVYSDLAAALKPRWYVLGTDGAVVGHWRSERIVARDDVGLLVEDVLAPADAPPRLDLHAPDGSVTRLATPSGAPYPFHAELADHLQLGLPMSVTGAQSRRVLAVLEAAAASAACGGRPVVPT